MSSNTAMFNSKIGLLAFCLLASLGGGTARSQRVPLALLANDDSTVGGYLLYPDGRPAVDQEFHAAIFFVGNAHTVYGSRFRTDARGSFALSIPNRTGRFALRQLDIRREAGSGDKHLALRAPFVRVDIGPILDAGRESLGTLRLMEPLIQRLESDHPPTDEELISAFNGYFGLMNWNDYAQREACMAEMVRRGGKEFRQVLREAYTSSRADLDSGAWNNSESLVLLTALRRLEGKRDPLQIAVTGPDAIEIAFPELPCLEVVLSNVDEERQSVFTRAPYAGCSWHSEFNVLTMDSNGAAQDPQLGLEEEDVIDGVFCQLDPSEERQVRLDLFEYLRPQTPGPITLKVEYHQGRATEARHRLATTSAPIRVGWQRRVVQLSEPAEAELRAQMEKWDESLPVPLTLHPFREGLSLSRPTNDHVAATVLDHGWRAIPVVVSALGEQGASPEKRAWLLSLLYNLTGILNPLSVERAIGPFVLFDGWRELAAEENQGETGTGGGPDREAQALLIAKWMELGALVSIER